MEYLVEMITTVPAGTSTDEVDAVRQREAANSERLAAEGSLLRLWRPPVQPGEWRTFGLFAAPGRDALEATLRTMPLRVWRNDIVTPLEPHPNDPGAGEVLSGAGVPEYFVTFRVTIPADADQAAVARATAQEAESARAHAARGTLARLWSLPSEGGTIRAFGVWRDHDQQHLQDLLDTLPLTPWMTIEVLPLSPHPSDPAGKR